MWYEPQSFARVVGRWGGGVRDSRHHWCFSILWKALAWCPARVWLGSWSWVRWLRAGCSGMTPHYCTTSCLWHYCSPWDNISPKRTNEWAQPFFKTFMYAYINFRRTFGRQRETEASEGDSCRDLSFSTRRLPYLPQVMIHSWGARQLVGITKSLLDATGGGTPTSLTRHVHVQSTILLWHVRVRSRWRLVGRQFS